MCLFTRPLCQILLQQWFLESFCHICQMLPRPTTARSLSLTLTHRLHSPKTLPRSAMLRLV